MPTKYKVLPIAARKVSMRLFKLIFGMLKMVNLDWSCKIQIMTELDKDRDICLEN